MCSMKASQQPRPLANLADIETAMVRNFMLARASSLANTTRFKEAPGKDTWIVKLASSPTDTCDDQLASTPVIIELLVNLSSSTAFWYTV
jgi:hypothetical protein